jgi:hypothetical protein
MFTPFSLSISSSHRLHTTSHARTANNKRFAAVRSIFDIAAACHLVPQYKALDELHLRHDLDVLAAGQRFYLNHFYNYFLFGLIEQWRAMQETAVAHQGQ